jgi:hypothetical protein
LRNESSVSIVFVNPAWRSLIVLTKARGPPRAGPLGQRTPVGSASEDRTCDDLVPDIRAVR